MGKEPVPQFLLEGLRILEARGYDSAGISTITQPGTLVTTKFASSGATNNAIDLVQSKLGPHAAAHIGNKPIPFCVFTLQVSLTQDGRLMVVPLITMPTLTTTKTTELLFATMVSLRTMLC